MTDTPPLSPQDEADALAAEYVLGVLSLVERTAAEARARRDADFAARISTWENRLSGLNDEFADVPAPDLLPRIEARLFPVAAKPRRAWAGWLIGAATAAALVIGAVYLTQTGPAPTLGGQLAAETGDLRFEAQYAGTTLTLTRISGSAAEAGRVHQLWLIAGEAAPVSLGLIEGDALSVTLPQVAEGIVLAVSLEPAGGSPTGAPTGPVLVTGSLTAI